MNSSQIKTLLIVLLAAANLFLAGNIALANRRRDTLPADMLQNAVELLAQSGIDVKVDDIPNYKPKQLIYEGVIDLEYIGTTSARLSGSEVTGTPAVQPDGVTYRLSAGEYQFEFDKYLSFSMKRAGYEAASTQMLQADSNFESAYNKDAFEQIRMALEEFLDNGEGSHSSYRVEYCDYMGKSIFARISQTVNGIGVQGHTLSLTFIEGRAVSAQGTWFFGRYTDRYEMPLLDAVNVMFQTKRSAKPLSGGITKIELLYAAKMHQADRFYLLPSWSFVLKDGSAEAYDALSGYPVGR